MVQIAGMGAKGAEADGQTESPQFEKVNWKKEPHLRKLYLMSAGLMVASATTGYDGMLVNTSQMMDSWNKFLSPKVEQENWLGLLVNMFNIGSIISFFITPYIADRWGRRTAIIIGCLFMVVGGVVGTASNGYNMYIAGRFILGFGNSLAQMCSPLLLVEIVHPQHRGPVTTIYNCLWNVGALVVSVIGWGTSYVSNDWSWRSITLLQIIPSVIQLCCIWWIPESPRYLINNDRNEEALNILTKWHGGGDVNNTVVQFEYREIKETIRLENEAGSDSSYLDFFRTKGNLWRLAIIMSLGIISQYSGNALFSNYMNQIYEGAGITSQNQKLGLSTGKTILDIIVTVAAAMQVDRYGRRPLFLISISGMVLSFICWTITGAVYENSNSTNTGSGYAQLVFIWLFGVSYDVGFSGLLIAYALEVLPFKLRAKGMMIMNITVQAILAISNQTNMVAWKNLPHHWNFMLFYTLWDFCELIFVYFMYPETKGNTLEEVAHIFDGEQAVAHIDLHQVEKEIQAEATYHETVTGKSAA
ncbi:putative MFS hexose transporter [Aspergillus clavatus NRRL 1]|uniref:MFS hexose transporter, putative n=1 Tax=Aspergillus clavatus (strain ATCC 1007 / CBS 513.65 / DSM 816 / NCTC 3887 / NRRL 1 / QM 1276 / 107) TaxID=344612 RepID=A1CCN7_ASPCL|nr:MFS hexose transporter, putative [Aspergillus clavatus NRRL 1]EAW12294.1 MFS hexose transporter, putative [Aspergillus clavatus NRRL 1]